MTDPKNKPRLRLAGVEDTASIGIPRIKGESDSHYAARCASIRALGTGWQGHPQYPSPARHSIHESVWKPARVAFIADIARRAAADRARNPAHAKWLEVLAVLGERV